MKKTIYGLLLCAVMLTVSACGTDEAGTQKSAHSETGEDVAGEEETHPSDIEDGLLGVYEGATEYVEVPMGIFFDGEQREFCNVKLPKEYIIEVTYTEDGESETTNNKVSGVRVETAVEFGLLEQEMASKWILIGSSGGTTVNFYIIPTSQKTLDDERTYAGDYKELSGVEYETVYCVDPHEYATSDLRMCCQINEDILVAVTYEGPLAEKLGLDQLAQNIYDLIEVTE